MTELEAAKAIAEGKLPSPHVFSNMTLFAVRVTGTGMAYRDSLDEYVWRDPSLYLNDKFLERVAGLPLIWEHPVTGSLNSKEFGKRIIGTMMFGYVVGEDVWGIARVYDDEAIKLMTDGQLSTSPGVVFGPDDGNVSGELPDGKTLLIEGIPSTLCHLAVCEAGVWDKGQDPTGVQNDQLNEENGSMADEHEEKAAADKARHDADAKHDEIMDALKKFDARIDAIEKDKRHDAARKDKFGKRKDGESYADYSKRHDAEEKEYADAIRNINDGASEKDCMDKARKDRKDAEEEEKRHDKDFDKWAKEEEEEHKGDKKDAKKDAEEKFEGAKDAKKDAEGGDDKKKEEELEKSEKEEEGKVADRKDSALVKENAEMKAALAVLQRQMKTITSEVDVAERDALATAQSRADSIFAMLGDRAPPPNTGETSLEYRRRLLKKLAPRSSRFKASKFDSLGADLIVPIEDQVYADAAGSARSIGDATVGTLVPFEERDRSGRIITKYHGDIGAFLAPFVPQQAAVGRINIKPNGV